MKQPTRHQYSQRRRAGQLFEALEGRRLLSAAASDPVASDDATPTEVATLEAPNNAVSGSTGAATATSEATTFLAPGILHTEADFDRMRQKVDAGAQPWLSGWNALISDGFSQAGWNPRPLATVIRGGDGSNFAQMVIDMQRAYQTAVRWKVSDNPLYADQAVRILNAWSSTHTELTGNADRFLASGLYAFGWAAAADIMRTYTGWAAADVTQFQNYLVNVYYPKQNQFLTGHNGAAITNYWANWDLANIEGMMAVGIFADRQDIYDEAVNYLFTGGGNGALDKAFYYLHPGNLMQWQESGRDQGHTTLGMGLFGHIAQMAWNQGLDLFSYNNYQFLAAAEYIAKSNLGYDVPFQTYNWGTGTSGAWREHTVIAGGSHGRRVYELIHAHYVERLGMAAPYSTQRVLDLRPEWRGSGDEFGFGTLTYPLDPLTTGLTPKGLTAAEKGAGNVQLDWFGSSNATGYNVYRSTSETGTYTRIASNVTDLLTYTDRNLPAGVYYYKVSGITAGGETGFSNVVSATSTNLAHTYLPFNETSGTSAADATGNGHGATLVNGATWAAGRSGNALSLDGANDYAELPTGFVADATDFTIAAWVNLNSAATWSRIFDFGDDRGNWMFLTPRNGNGQLEFATSTVYGYNKQWVVGTSALPTGQWVHVAVTLSDRVGTLYVNGVAVGSNANMAFPPSQIGATPRNWIGRSQFGNDPYLNGKVDDFRIYRGALKPAELYAMATGNPAPAPPAAPASLNAAAVVGNAINLSWPSVAGATRYTVRRSTTSGGPYTAIATLLSGTTFSDTNRTAGVTYYYVVSAYNNGGDGPDSPQASAVALPPMPATPTNLAANAIASSAIGLTWSASADAATYSVKRASASGGPFTTIASGLTATSYTDTGRTAGTTYYYVVTAVNASGESGNSNVDSATPSDLIAHLKFDQSSGTTATDSGTNGWNGTLVNGPLWTTGRVGNAVDLDGVDDHVTLPAGVMNGVTNFTIATWVFQDASSNWARVFDFGTGTTRNMFLTPQNGANGRVRFAITTGGGGGEQQITGTAALPVGAWTHVAVTLNGSVGILYVNGVEVARNSAMTLNPAILGSTNLNYLGRSQYADPYLNGRIDDFRIYARALAAGEVSTLAGGNAPAAPGALNAIPDDGQVFLSWPAVPGASSYTLKRATVSGGPYTTIASGLTSTSRTDASVINSFTYYYVVTATNILGDGAASPQAAATPMPTFTGGDDDDHWVLRRSGSRLQIWIGDGSGTPAYDVPYASVGSLTFDGAGGNDMLTLDGTSADDFAGVSFAFSGGDDDDTLMLDFADGVTIQAGHVDYDGGAGVDTVVVRGTSGDDVVQFTAANVSFPAGSVAHTGIEQTNFDGGGGWDDLSVSGAAVAVTIGQRFSSLTLDAATVTLPPGDSVLVTRSLQIAGGSRLDLADNDLIVDYGPTEPSPEFMLRDLVKAFAENPAATTGIAFTPGAGDVAIAIAEKTEWGQSVFNGVTLDDTTVIGKYTYYGDANLDGKVTSDDYVAVDVGLGTGDSWVQGDFNFSGSVTSDDYVAIDVNLGKGTGEPLATADEFTVVDDDAALVEDTPFVEVVEQPPVQRDKTRRQKLDRPVASVSHGRGVAGNSDDRVVQGATGLAGDVLLKLSPLPKMTSRPVRV